MLSTDMAILTYAKRLQQKTSILIINFQKKRGRGVVTRIFTPLKLERILRTILLSLKMYICIMHEYFFIFLWEQYYKIRIRDVFILHKFKKKTYDTTPSTYN